MAERKIVTLGLLYGIVFIALLPAAQTQEITVRVVDNEIFTEDKFGNVRQLTKDGEPKENVIVGFGTSKVIYHTKSNPYEDPPQPPVFTVLDVNTGETLKKIPIYWRSRYIARVEWVSESLLAVEGEGLAIIDVEQGRQIHYIPSAHALISTDREKIVFPEPRYPIYGPKPPAEDSDALALALMDKGLPARKEGEVPCSPAMTIYPKVYAWDGDQHETSFDDLDERHWVKSNLSWSPDSQKVAFIEYQRKTFWAVALKITTSGEQVKVEQKRVDLGKEFNDMNQEKPRALTSRVEWMPDNQAIKVASGKSAWVVDIENNKITQVDGPSSNQQ